MRSFLLFHSPPPRYAWARLETALDAQMYKLAITMNSRQFKTITNRASNSFHVRKRAKYNLPLVKTKEINTVIINAFILSSTVIRTCFVFQVEHQTAQKANNTQHLIACHEVTTPLTFLPSSIVMEINEI